MVEYQIVVYDAPIWTVYMHVNKVNGKKYVGITSESNPQKRWGKNGNRYKATSKKHKSIFYEAIQKYGWDNFDHIILMTGLSKLMACVMEVSLIKEFKTHVSYGTGYNAYWGGQYGSFKIKPSKESLLKRSGKNNHTSIKVICLNTGKIYDCMIDAAREYGLSQSCEISIACKGVQQFSGKDCNGNPLIWMYYNEYIKLSEDEINDKLNKPILKTNSHPIICINNGKIFYSADAAAEYGGLTQSSGITRCCQSHTNTQSDHIRHRAGKDPISGEGLSWMYLDEYNSLTDVEKQLLRNQVIRYDTSVICLNSLEIFKQQKQIDNIINQKISKNISYAIKTRSYAGFNPKTGEHLYWIKRYDYRLMSDEERQELKDKYYTGNFLLPENQKEGNNNENK